MDFGVWAIAMSISFAMCILAVKDRVIGIAGVLAAFVTNAVAGNDGVITVARGFNSSGSPISATIPFQPEFLVLAFVIIACEVVLMFSLNDRYGHQDEDESGLLQSAFDY